MASVTLADNLRTRRVREDEIPVVDFGPFRNGSRGGEAGGRQGDRPRLRGDRLLLHPQPRRRPAFTRQRDRRDEALLRAAAGREGTASRSSIRACIAAITDRAKRISIRRSSVRAAISRKASISAATSGPTIPTSRPGCRCTAPTSGRRTCRAGSETMNAYYDSMVALGKQVMSSFAVALDLPEDHFAKDLTKPMTTLAAAALSAAARRDHRRADRRRRAHGFRLLHDAVAGPDRRIAGAQRARRMGRCRADSRHLCRQCRRHDGALDQRPVRLDLPSRDQRRRRRTLFDAVLLRSEFQGRGQLPADLPQGTANSAKYPPTTGGQHLLDRIDETFAYRKTL